MPSRFAAEVLAATAAIDAEMAGTFTLVPMKAVDDTRAAPAARPDTSRIVANFQAQYFDPEAKPDRAYPNAHDTHSQNRIKYESGHPRLELSPYELARTGLVIGVNDMVVRRGTGIAYQIERAPFVTQGGRRILPLLARGLDADLNATLPPVAPDDPFAAGLVVGEGPPGPGMSAGTYIDALSGNVYTDNG